MYYYITRKYIFSIEFGSFENFKNQFGQTTPHFCKVNSVAQVSEIVAVQKRGRNHLGDLDISFATFRKMNAFIEDFHQVHCLLHSNPHQQFFQLDFRILCLISTAISDSQIINGIMNISKFIHEYIASKKSFRNTP